MSYNKLGFTKGQTLKAEHLNYMEEGIANAGGASSWNDLKDKPFGETNHSPIILEEVTEDSIWLEMPSGQQFVKVSDEIFEVEDFTGAIAVQIGNYYGDSHHQFQYPVKAFPFENGFVVVCFEQDTELPVVISFTPEVAIKYGAPEAGTYFAIFSDGHISSLTFAPTVKKIDVKYLPGVTMFYHCYDQYLYLSAEAADYCIEDGRVSSEDLFSALAGGGFVVRERENIYFPARIEPGKSGYTIYYGLSMGDYAYADHTSDYEQHLPS